MIQRDYLLRMIEEFSKALARIQALKKDQRLQEAALAVDAEFERLVGGGAEAVARLTETELLARLMQGEPTQVVREKTLILATLLKEKGDVSAAQEDSKQASAAYLKGLHLLLEVLAREEVFECPAFVPKVDEFVLALAGTRLSIEMLARLMHHYERLGEFARAEDTFFAMTDLEPRSRTLLEFGLDFYSRVAAQDDAALVRGNLPRAELEDSREELATRLKNVNPAG